MPYSLRICVAFYKLEILLSLKAAAGEAVIMVSYKEVSAPSRIT